MPTDEAPDAFHILNYIEEDDDGADEDIYRCTCGQEFQANGDIVTAFYHGWDSGFDAGKTAGETL